MAGQTDAFEALLYLDFCSERGLDIVDVRRPRTLSRHRITVA
jgi:hypothetical protein